jgi:aminopeptidase N
MRCRPKGARAAEVLADWRNAMIDRIIKAIPRGQLFAPSIVLPYLLSGSVGIPVAHSGAGFAPAQRDTVVEKADISGKSFLTDQDPAPEAFVTRHAQLDLRVDFEATRLSGAMTLEVENWTAKPASSVSILLHRLMEASQVTDGGGSALASTQDVLRFRDDPIRQVTQLLVTFPRPISPGARATLRIDYAGYLTPYTEVGWLYVKDHIDTTFTIIRSDALAFPVIGGLSSAANRRAPYPDFTYDVAVRVPSKYLVATGGTATRTRHEDGTATWRYTSGKASPFLNIAIAPFDTLSTGRMRVFFFPADSAGARRLLHSAETALQVMTRWFGPLQTDANVTITEIPDGWGSQANLVGGIIQQAAAFREATRIGELYHELSHLWNAVDTDRPSPRWNEGLATFLEGLLRERVDGWTNRRAADSTTIAWAKTAVDADSLLRVVPMIDYGKRDMTERSYGIGDLMFATLHDLVGEDEFNRVIGGYYQRFANGGTTHDFVEFAKRAATRDLTTFFDDWMFTTRWTKVLAGVTSVGGLVAHYATKAPS